jgi:DNA-binding HxlR family transcriptional regulator
LKNTAVSSKREPQTVAHQDLIAVMKPNKRYTQDQICALLPDRPRMAVRDTLASLVNKGLIWRDGASTRVHYALLEGDALRSAIDRLTAHATPPDWMRANLQGYDESHRQFRDLCMATRR